MFLHATWRAGEGSQNVIPTISLQTPLQLTNGKYEIALLEASFTPKFINVPLSSSIKFLTENASHDIEFPSSESISSVTQLNLILREIFEKAELKSKVKVVKSPNVDKIKWTVSEEVTLDMNSELRKFLGLEGVVLTDLKNYESVPQLFPNLRRIFLQTEFISPTHYIKNKKAPILNSMTLYSDKEVCSRTFSNPIFQQMNVSWLEKLDVKFTDENGNVLKMSDGFAYALLLIKEKESQF